MTLSAGFVSEHCNRHLRSGEYRISDDDLDRHLIPKGDAPAVATLHESQRGVAYTTSPFAFVFTRA